MRSDEVKRLLELAERVENSNGPDREIEIAIWRLIDLKAADVEAEGRTPLPWLHCYTESLDAARKLIPEGMIWMLTNTGLAGKTPDFTKASAVVENWESTFPMNIARRRRQPLPWPQPLCAPVRQR